MKNCYNKTKYKKWHNRRAQRKGRKKKRNKKYDPNKTPIYKRSNKEIIRADPVIAPPNICVFEGAEESLIFFSRLRKQKYISKIGRVCFVQMDIQNVNKFDYSSICILMAIIQDLKAKGVILRGNFPNDPTCKELIIESGLLNFMFDQQGNPFKKAEKSDMLFIERGSGKLTRKDNIGISNTLKKISKHLIQEEKHLPKLRTILLEICGNSIEWGGTLNKDWLLGVLYDEDKVTITITDVGIGILKTLNKKFKHKFSDIFMFKSSAEILEAAFIKKYGSSTREPNRNKGLPSIKNGFDDGIINNLRVLTNDVLLNFDNDNETRVLKNTYFRGTLYRWEVTKETIKKAI